MRRDPEGVRARRGRRPVRRRVRRDAGPVRRVRRDARHRHADLRVGDRRHQHRRGAARLPAGRRDAVRRLHLVRVRSDRQPGGDASLPVRRPRVGADRRPRAERRQRRRRAVSLAESRGVVRPPAGPEGRGAVDRLRREGTAEGGDSRRQPGRLLRAQVSVPPREGPGARKATRSCRSASRRRGGRATTSRC